VNGVHHGAENAIEYLGPSFDLEVAIDVVEWYDFVKVKLTDWVDDQSFSARHAEGPQVVPYLCLLEELADAIRYSKENKGCYHLHFDWVLMFNLL
jgi:hypothetical protein